MNIEEYRRFIDDHMSCGKYQCDCNFNGYCISDDMNNYNLCIMDIATENN